MKLEEFKIKMNKYAINLGIELSENQIDKFYKYMNLLLEWDQQFLKEKKEKRFIALGYFLLVAFVLWREKTLKVRM